MNHYELVRSYLPDRTVGQLTVGAMAFCSVERPWIDNQPNISCIPEGTYLVEPDDTGKHRWYSICNVPERTFIEIHTANKPSQLAGCIALGHEFAANFDVLESKDAMTMLINAQGNKPFILTIRQFNPHYDKWSS